MSGHRYDQELVRRERERFIVLLHVYNLSAQERTALSADRIADVLALARWEVRAILDLLLRHSYLAPVGGGNAVVVAPLGAEYIERLAGRRQSLRLN